MLSQTRVANTSQEGNMHDLMTFDDDEEDDPYNPQIVFSHETRLRIEEDDYDDEEEQTQPFDFQAYLLSTLEITLTSNVSH